MCNAWVFLDIMPRKSISWWNTESATLMPLHTDILKLILLLCFPLSIGISIPSKRQLQNFPSTENGWFANNQDQICSCLACTSWNWLLEYLLFMLWFGKNTSLQYIEVTDSKGSLWGDFLLQSHFFNLLNHIFWKTYNIFWPVILLQWNSRGLRDKVIFRYFH